jgi:glycosyltransferase involved in cell wall biosynthesis
MLRTFLKKEQIDILHTHNYKSNFYGLLASFGLDIHLATTCHTWFGDQLKMRFFFSLDKLLLNQFDRVFVVSEPIKEEVLQSHVRPKKVSVVWNGIDPDRFNNRSKESTNLENARTELGIQKNWKVIGTVGRLTDQKGHVYFLEAAKRIAKGHSNVCFLIVGDGPLKTSLMIQSKGLPVIFAGVRNDMPTMYALMDVFVLPSLDEGLPMVLLEAMASKTPVIATPVGEIPTVIEDNHSGLLVPPGDVNALAEAMIDVLQNPPKAKAFANRALAVVRQNYSSRTMAKTYAELYKDVLQQHRNRG